MTYSLVSMPVLGFDLSRLPGGADAAEILLAALQLGRGDLADIARRHPGSAHRARWAQVQRMTARPGVAAGLRHVADGLFDTGSSESVGVGRLLTELERAPLGSLDALLRLVRTEIFDWAWHGTAGVRMLDDQARAVVDVLGDALAASYAADILPPALARELAAPWAQTRRKPVNPDLGPHTAAVRVVLRRVAGLTGSDRARLRLAVDAIAADRGTWSAAVHDASWAVHLTDRVREAAAAQLLTVRSFTAGGLTASDGAEGVWNAVSGLVQSLIVRDLIGDETTAALQGFWTVAFGEDPVRY